MADINLLAPKILKWESEKYVDDPLDSGGATKDGVILATWRVLGHDNNGDGVIDKEDIKLITHDEFIFVLRVGYWNKWQADEIKNQSISNILVDWVWGSGAYGIKIPQMLMSVIPDGSVGIKTITALNNFDQFSLFNKIHDARIKFINDIVIAKPSQIRFKHGWLNRLADFQFTET